MKGNADSAEDRPEKQNENKTKVSPAQVGGTALASVTAAFLGSRLGVAGTVVGAGLTSVIITVGGALYQRSIETTREKAAAAAAKASGLRQRRTRLSAPEGPTRKIEVTGLRWPGGEAVEEPRPVEEPRTLLSPPVPRRRWGRWALVGATGALAFVVSMVLVTGVEGLTGRPLSGGDGTTLGKVLQPAPVRVAPADPTSSEPAPTSENPSTEPSAPPSTERPEPSAPPTESGSPTTQPPATESAPESTDSAPQSTLPGLPLG
ncbi:hypothetical protein SAMN05660874_01987 [Saccharopolyspora flava]|uniref:Uncharacterized protein n=1 Tax=Saccharopolyspora flava TaxID=95161 RepID=A0A1I6QWI9_9PSEU|nr:hypothetical protein SAMN05660874_01987 [Saccharopolyspora flava]